MRQTVALGSYITNLDGEVVQHIEYVPFGEVFLEERNNSWNSPYLFNAKELDEETGLYYYGARYYNPRESVWLSVDPLTEMFPGWSPYNYTLQNPVKLIDPTGMGPEDPPEKEVGTGVINIYESKPLKGGGREVTLKGTYNRNIPKDKADSNENHDHVSVLDEKGNTIKAYAGAGAYAKYSRDYGAPKEFTTIMSDGLNSFERTLFAIGDVTYIALTNTESQVVVLMPLGVLTDIFLAGSVTGGAITTNALIKGAQSSKNANLIVQFGKTENQIYHAFRHTDAMGLSRANVQTEVMKHLNTVSSKIQAGKPLNSTITVQGQKIQYSAYKLSDGTINIGRIHGTK